MLMVPWFVVTGICFFLFLLNVASLLCNPAILKSAKLKRVRWAHIKSCDVLGESSRRLENRDFTFWGWAGLNHQHLVCSSKLLYVQTALTTYLRACLRMLHIMHALWRCSSIFT